MLCLVARRASLRLSPCVHVRSLPRLATRSLPDSPCVAFHQLWRPALFACGVSTCKLSRHMRRALTLTKKVTGTAFAAAAICTYERRWARRPILDRFRSKTRRLSTLVRLPVPPRHITI